VDGRVGRYERELETKAGGVKLRVTRLLRLPFEFAIIERYKRRKASVEEALVEIAGEFPYVCLDGVVLNRS
jgi:putative transposase